MGMYAIAALIQERAKQRKLTPAQVCKQHKQFSVWNDKKERDLWHLWKSTSAPYARQLARYVCKGYGFANVTGRADHYYSKKIRSKPPYWAKGRKASATIGNHVFYRLAKN
jgi:spore germination cell wall hydrolase CwlJ-like protein